MAKGLLVISYTFNVLLSIAFVLTIGALIDQESTDIVRLTVNSEELLPTVQQAQGLTHRVAYAFPVNQDETKWRVVIDKNSESTD